MVKQRFVEVTRMLIVPKMKFIPRTGCYLTRDDSDIYIINNGSKFKLRDEKIILRVDGKRLFITMKTLNLEVIRRYIDQKDYKTVVIIPNRDDKDFLLNYLKDIYKQETIGYYLSDGIMVTDF